VNSSPTAFSSNAPLSCFGEIVLRDLGALLQDERNLGRDVLAVCQLAADIHRFASWLVNMFMPCARVIAAWQFLDMDVRA
jgi:hypothetical protein